MIDKVRIFNLFHNEGDVYLTILTHGATVPSHIHKKKTETFILGEISTPDLTYNEEGINASMKFLGKLFDCFFPWDCIISFLGKDAVIHFTHEIIENKSEESFAVKEVEGKERKKGHLKIVK